MVALGIVFAALALICRTLRFTGSWIDKHDKQDAKPWQIKIITTIHIILAAPIWAVEIMVRKVRRLWKGENHERTEK